MPELVFRTLREEVTDAIRMKILKGEIGMGERIIEQDIASELGVSRGPVREALRQIEQEGLIQYTRNVGCSVKKITVEDIYDIYLLRANYEIQAIKLCRGLLTDETKEKMEEALVCMKMLTETTFSTVISYDNAFHGAIVKQTGLPRLYAAWENLNSGNVISYYAGNSDYDAAVKRQYAIHKKLIDVCRTGDTQVMCEAMMDHYMSTIHRRLRELGQSEESFPYPMDNLL